MIQLHRPRPLRRVTHLHPSTAVLLSTQELNFLFISFLVSLHCRLFVIINNIHQIGSFLTYFWNPHLKLGFDKSTLCFRKCLRDALTAKLKVLTSFVLKTMVSSISFTLVVRRQQSLIMEYHNIDYRFQISPDRSKALLRCLVAVSTSIKQFFYISIFGLIADIAVGMQRRRQYPPDIVDDTPFPPSGNRLLCVKIVTYCRYDHADFRSDSPPRNSSHSDLNPISSKESRIAIRRFPISDNGTLLVASA